MFLGTRIRDLRAERTLTLEEVAAKVAISPSYLSAIERGLKRPSIPMLKHIAEVMNVSVTCFFADGAGKSLGQKIRLIREGRNLSPEELGEVCGLSQQDITAFEESGRIPDLDTLHGLADALNVTVRYFLESGAASRTTMGERLKEFRERQGLTLTQLAERAGVSAGLVSQIEHNTTMPSLETLETIAGSLGVSVCYFLLEQERIEDLLASLGPDVREMLNDPRVQSVLRAVRDFSAGELKHLLNYIQFFKRYRHLLR
ncbi:MAG TPA: helix-turn-helix transcriptional regulator [Symbiobacteriaceae bacterium]|jgi:transcriptional regulator with XRE-family HTH domain